MVRLLTPDDKKSHRVVTLEIPNSDIEKFQKEVLKRYRKAVRIPGFRPGKAPEAIVLANYGDAIKVDALEEAAKDMLDQTLRAQKIRHVYNLEFTDVREKPDGSGYTITVEFDTVPRFDIPPLSNIKVERRIKRVTSADVDEAIDADLIKLGQYVPVEREAAEGDFIFFDLVIYEKTPKGKFRPIKKYNNRMLALDQREVTSEAIESFTGKKAGDTVEVTEEVQGEDGKKHELKYVYHIRSVREFQVPELDDELAQDMGFESVEDMKNKYREKLEQKAREDSEKKVESEIALKIHEIVGFDVPEFLIENHRKFLKERIFGVRDEVREELEKFIEQFATELAIKEIVVFNAVEELEPEVTDEEIQEELDKIAKENNLDKEQYIAELKKRGRYESVIREIKEELVRRKAWDYLKSGVNMEVVLE